MNNLDVLFVGQFYPEDKISTFQDLSKQSLDYAAHNFQSALIRGFTENNFNVSYLNIPPIGSYPFFFRNIFVDAGFDKNNISYLNFPIIKWHLISSKVYKKTLNWILSKPAQSKKIILIYSYTFLNEIYKATKGRSDVKIVLLIADMPDFSNQKENLLTKLRSLIPNKTIDFSMASAYILVSQHINNLVNLENKRYMVLEGIYNDTQNTISKPKKKYITYTGGLYKKYGILDMLNAVDLIEDKEYRFIFCGTGDCVEEIKSRKNINPNIEYRGVLNRSDVLSLQQESTLLLNPRHSNESWTKYSFPSKTLEYLASGTPVVMNRLESIPKEYFEFLTFLSSEDSYGIASTINNILKNKLDDLNLKGIQAKNFIRIHKSSKSQTKRIINFISEL